MSKLEEEIKKYLKKERWISYLSEVPSQNKAYRVSHSSLILAAKIFPPKYTGNNVTDFSGWVYSLCHPNFFIDNRELGKSGEKEVQRRKKEYYKKFLDKPQHSDWELDYFDDLVIKTPSLVISSLNVNENCFYGKPDYVFKHKSTGEIVIVDIKISYKEIPSDGWPNLRAQLWAYSQIDRYKHASKITLVGEVWDVEPLKRRGIVRWQALNEKFNAENEELFNLYITLAV